LGIIGLLAVLVNSDLNLAGGYVFPSWIGLTSVKQVAGLSMLSYTLVTVICEMQFSTCESKWGTGWLAASYAFAVLETGVVAMEIIHSLRMFFYH
jgi:hypothetical protein